MFDQSFNIQTLSRMVRRSDFKKNPTLVNPRIRLAYLKDAIKSAQNGFGKSDPLERYHLDGKQAYRIKFFEDELVIRHLGENIERAGGASPPSREFVIANLVHLLSEGVPYRLYRLDVKSFYESFSTIDVAKTVSAHPDISPVSKRLLGTLLSTYSSSGGQGLPRGLALSAVLSEFMMVDFDSRIATMPGVYFVGRYVDDIVAITSGEENVSSFVGAVASLLPSGLSLHGTKRSILTAHDIVTPGATATKLFAFDYLGYQFTVNEPGKVKGQSRGSYSRDVVIDIANSKIRRIKTRIVRSFLAFKKTSDFDMLELRLKFLTSNFSIKDFNRNRYKLAGIYFSYPQVTRESAKGLRKLDLFLKSAVLSGIGRLFSSTATMLSKLQRRQLLANSFERGHRKRLFVHYHPNKIKQIQECWVHE